MEFPADIKEVIEDISAIIRYDSSQQPPEGDMPFGRGAAECLEYFLSLARSYGFETKNYDNYAGEVIFGEGEEFAVLVHLDVVPAGSGWTHEPFGGETDCAAGRVWGRGAMDDKGPAVISLHALRRLKEQGFKPRRRIKLIAGCNEENGWACMDYYRRHAHMPEEGFSPDADFPVIYAEKGILQVELSFTGGGGFRSLCGGERANMVCDYCSVEADIDDKQLAAYGLTRENGAIVSRGISAHGSAPDKGVNAISPVLRCLGLNEVHRLLFGDGFGLGALRDETGGLTFSPDVISQEGDEIRVICDIRYPATLKSEQVLQKIEERGVKYRVLHHQLPLYNDAHGRLITTLCGVYNEVTGGNLKPIAIGGGTYARVLKCGAAFGPEEAGEESTIHKPDEYITFEKIEKCLKIYTLAIKRLTENAE